MALIEFINLRIDLALKIFAHTSQYKQRNLKKRPIILQRAVTYAACKLNIKVAH